MCLRVAFSHEAILTSNIPDFPRIEPGQQPVSGPVFVTPPNPNYMVWLLVIVIGVAGGNLLSTWVTARIVEIRLESAAKEVTHALRLQSEQVSRAANEAAARADAARIAERERLLQIRASDPMGSKLARQCQDWKQMNKQVRSFTAASEEDKSCRRYQHYLETGQATVK